MARSRGINPAARARFQAALGAYSGTYAIEEERQRERDLNISRSEREFPSQYMTPIVYVPNDDHDPSESSRVKAFRFVSNMSPDDRLAGERYGTVFVRFIKYDTPWKYTGVPQSVYESFASSRSKGKFINSTLNRYSYARATQDEVQAFFKDI